MRKFVKSALFFCSAIGLSVIAYAGNHTTDGVGNDGNTFWALFKFNTNNLCPTAGAGSNYACGVNVLNPSTRNAFITFDNPDRPDTDFVGGVGWGYGNVAKPSTVSYKVSSYSFQSTAAYDNRGVFGIYGWSCPADSGIKKPNGSLYENVEFYIVDHWLGSNQYTPYYNGSPMSQVSGGNGSVNANGGTYKIYKSGIYNRENACAKNSNGTNRNFIQVWAVRQGKRALVNSSGGIANNVDFNTISNKLATQGYFKYPLAYLVAGVDVFQDARGSVTFEYVNKN